MPPTLSSHCDPSPANSTAAALAEFCCDDSADDDDDDVKSVGDAVDYVERFVQMILAVPGHFLPMLVAKRLFAAEHGAPPVVALGKTWRQQLRDDGRTFFFGRMIVCVKGRHLGAIEAERRLRNALCFQIGDAGIDRESVAVVYHSLGVCQPCRKRDKCGQKKRGGCSFCHNPACIAADAFSAH